MIIVVGLATQAAMAALRRQTPIAPEQRRAAPPTITLAEAQANHARLAAAVKREADEKAARERADRDDAEARALAKTAKANR